MKKIGILQVDGKFPNLALMKICGYYESIGYEVEHYKGNMFIDEYEHIYASKMFSFSEMPILPSEKSTIGGTGIDFFNKMPKNFEDATPSYSLYNDCNFHLGFSMKGCRFNCKFCCVPKKEGKPYNYNSIDEILINPNGGDRLMLLDNDFFGGDNWKGNLERIIELKLKVCFIQGLNIRIITKEQAELLSKCRYFNSGFKGQYLTFAWDKFKDEKIIMKGIEICNNAGIPTKKMQFFVLIGFDTTPEQDLHRLYLLKQMGAMPYAMPYNKKDPYQRSICNYVNGFRRVIFNNNSYEDYLKMAERKFKQITKYENQTELFNL